ncbi:MAG TPA: hypothetical protein VGG09_03400, partial [Acidimicrobiales bacterium]
MRSALRVFTAGCAVALLSLPLALLGGGAVEAATPHGLTAPAQVSASSWATMPTTAAATPTNTDTGVSCVSSVFCMAVGNGYYQSTPATTAESWNGSTWSPLTMPTVANSTGGVVLAGVSCVTTGFCMAAGYAYYSSGNTYTSLVEQWNGTAWSVTQGTVAPSSDNYLYDVSCLSTTFCMAIGGTDTAPYVEQWNGSTWTPTTLSIPGGFSDAYFSAISCTTISSCMAVGYTNGSSTALPLAELWNGSTWTVTPVPAVTASPNYGLDGVSCAGPSFCAAVGGNENKNVVETWNGSSWTLDTVATPSGGGNLIGVSCFSATSCTAVGELGDAGASGNTPQALTWDGQNWSEATTPASPTSSSGSDYYAVDCITDWACVAAGDAQMSGSNYLPLEAMAPIARSGYRFVASDGGIFNYGAGAPFLGSMGGQPLNAPIVGMATMPAGD